MKMKFKRSMKVAIACVVIFTLALCPVLISKPDIAKADSANVNNYKEAKAYLEGFFGAVPYLTLSDDFEEDEE